MSAASARPRATVVILAWNTWARTRDCLASLRLTLDVVDRVAVDNGSADETAAELAAYPWLEVRTNAQNQGFARGCNHGASGATTEQSSS